MKMIDNKNEPDFGAIFAATLWLFWATFVPVGEVLPFFVQVWAVNKFERSAGEVFLSSKRGVSKFSETFGVLFRTFFCTIFRIELKLF